VYSDNLTKAQDYSLLTLCTNYRVFNKLNLAIFGYVLIMRLSLEIAMVFFYLG
jgi:hypothetical protein